MFKFDGVEDGLEFYKSEDGQYSVIKRTDNIFLLYKLENDIYTYTGHKLYSLEECETFIQ